MTKTFIIHWQEKDGSTNRSIIEASKMSDAVAHIEADERCDYVRVCYEQ